MRMGTQIRDTERLEEADFGDRGRVHQPGNAGSLEKLEKAGKRFSPLASEGTQPCPPVLGFDLQNCKIINLCGFKPLHLSSFLLAAG